MPRAKGPTDDRAVIVLLEALAQAGAAAQTARAFRERALDLLQPHVPFDAAFVHALNPRVPLEQGVFRNLDPARLAKTLASWDQYAVDLARWRSTALAQRGVAVDTEVFSPRERTKLDYFVHFSRPLRIRTCALVHLVVRERVLAVMALLRTRDPRPFAPDETALLRAAAPVLALGDALAQSAPVVAPLAQRDHAPVCVDTRLTARQRELVSRVALGQTNPQIAAALGRSTNTVRNQLARAMERVGAGNRAELVRLAVLR